MMSSTSGTRLLTIATFVMLTQLSGICRGHAEYRAYELRIMDQGAATEYRVVTTLDHLQYANYYPLRKTQQIYYIDSWMCWGNTSYHKPICPNPKAPKSPTVQPTVN